MHHSKAQESPFLQQGGCGKEGIRLSLEPFSLVSNVDLAFLDAAFFLSFVFNDLFVHSQFDLLSHPISPELVSVLTCRSSQRRIQNPINYLR